MGGGGNMCTGCFYCNCQNCKSNSLFKCLNVRSGFSFSNSLFVVLYRILGSLYLAYCNNVDKIDVNWNTKETPENAEQTIVSTMRHYYSHSTKLKA